MFIAGSLASSPSVCVPEAPWSATAASVVRPPPPSVRGLTLGSLESTDFREHPKHHPHTHTRLALPRVEKANRGSGEVHFGKLYY